MEQLIQSYMCDNKYDKTTDLCHIMKRNQSDKGLDWHNYTTFYDLLFKNMRPLPLNIFELGLGTNDTTLKSNMGAHGRPGASHYGWKEYFYNSNIYGADIDKKILFEEERIQTFYCDQTNPESIQQLWNHFNVDFDIMIEDGLHEFEANYTFLCNSIHKLKSNGIYIIEDLNQETVKKFKEIASSLQTTYQFQSIHILTIPYKNNHDNALLIIQK